MEKNLALAFFGSFFAVAVALIVANLFMGAVQAPFEAANINNGTEFASQ
jgi:hypothetical protein